MHETATSFFNLESPADGAEIPAGRQQLRGWMVPKPGNHFVNVRAQVGTRIFPGAYGFPRTDLAAHFEPSRKWLPAEFIIEVDFQSGNNSVVIEALSLAGQWQRIHQANFVIRDTPIPPVPTPDPISAEEFGRAIQLGMVAGDETPSRISIVNDLPFPRVIRADHLPFLGYISEPTRIAPAFYGQMEVVGWLFHETQPLQNAFVTTDLLTFQPLEIGGEFIGVRERYPDKPHAGNSRIRGFVDVSHVLPSPACLRLYAELPDGSMHLCLAVHCRPQTTEEIKKTCSSFSFWKFWQRWRTAKQTLIQQGIGLESGSNLRREFWSTYRQCRRRVAPNNSAALQSPPALPAVVSNRKLRLLLITHNLNFEGAPLLFVEYARHLAEKQGAEISVLTIQEGPLRAAFESIGASVTVVDCAAQAPAELRDKIEEISRKLDWAKIDLVVANTIASFWGVALARLGNRPSLLYIHESTSPFAFFLRTTPALLPAVHDAFRDATAVSFNTSATQAYYATLGSGKNFHLNSAWIDLTALKSFRTAHPQKSLRDQLGLRSDELLITNIGTVCERKGQHDFLRAVEWLWRRAPDLAARCRFVMVGARNTLYNQTLAKDLAAIHRPNIQIIPETAGAYDYFGAADLFVCTSYEESFPRVVLEAMAFAVPIVSTNVHGIPYMLQHEKEAILVAPGDIDALTNGMLQLLQNPTLARDLPTRAQARVNEFAAELVLPLHANFAAQVAALRP